MVKFLGILQRCLVGCNVNFSFSGSSYTLSALINAATLIVQQLRRGFGLAKSFYKACWDIYVSSQQSGDNQKVSLPPLEMCSSSVCARESTFAKSVRDSSKSEQSRIREHVYIYLFKLTATF